MPCPNCDHTMHSLTDSAARKMWHCPRCGTLKTESYGVKGECHVELATPMLVTRCRMFETVLDADHDPKAVGEWHRLGIAESLNLPGDRPK